MPGLLARSPSKARHFPGHILQCRMLPGNIPAIRQDPVYPAYLSNHLERLCASQPQEFDVIRREVTARLLPEAFLADIIGIPLLLVQGLTLYVVNQAQL